MTAPTDEQVAAGRREEIAAEVAKYVAAGWTVLAVMAAPDVAASIGPTVAGLPVEEHDEWSWGWAPRLAARAILERQNP